MSKDRIEVDHWLSEVEELAETYRGNMAAYLALLAQWNRVHNLTRVPEHEWVKRHLQESLSFGNEVGERIIDMGTGAGLPGLVLAMAYPEKQFLLIDSAEKKILFLRWCIQKLHLKNVETQHTRLENYTPASAWDTVVSKAMAASEFILQHTKDWGIKQWIFQKSHQQMQAAVDIPGWRRTSVCLPEGGYLERWER